MCATAAMCVTSVGYYVTAFCARFVIVGNGSALNMFYFNNFNYAIYIIVMLRVSLVRIQVKLLRGFESAAFNA
jgi:hypothetical protein